MLYTFTMEIKKYSQLLVVLNVLTCILVVRCSDDVMVKNTLLKSNDTTLGLSCTQPYLVHFASVNVIHHSRTELCKTGTMIIRNHFEGKGHADLDDSDLVDYVISELHKVCSHRGDFQITYQCLQLPSTPAAVIDPTHVEHAHVRSDKNYTMYLHSDQFSRSSSSRGFQCSISTKRPQDMRVVMVTIYDLHKSDPNAIDLDVLDTDTKYPIYCIKNGRIQCHRGQLDATHLSLKVNDTFQLSSQEDGFENTYFIEIKAFQGAKLSCQPNQEVIPAHRIHSSPTTTVESSTTTTTGHTDNILDTGTDDSNTLGNHLNYASPWFILALGFIAVLLLVIFVLVMILIRRRNERPQSTESTQNLI